VDTVTGTVASYDPFFKYEDHNEDFYAHIKQTILTSSSVSGANIDAERLEAFCTEQKSIKYFAVEENGLRFYFGRDDFVVDAEYVSILVPTEAFAHFGEPKQSEGGGNSTDRPNVEFPHYQPVISASEKVIALTFDDGPHYNLTKKLLDILEAKKVKATFFVLGERIDTNGDGKIETWARNYLQRAVSLGCEIGNHTYDHLVLSSKNVPSKEKLIEQIKKTNDLIFQGIGYNSIVFRAPGGALQKTWSTVTADLGYNIVNWKIDTEDWKKQGNWKSGKTTREEAVNLTVDVIKEQAASGRIILMHDIWDISIDAASIAIDHLLAEGYRFVTVSELCDLLNREPDATVIYTRSSIY